MVLGSGMPRVRGLLVWVAASVMAASVASWLVAPLAEVVAAAERGTLGAGGFVPVLVGGCAAIGMAVTCWLWVVTSVVLADVWRGLSVERRGVPLVVRRATLLLCGAALAGLPTPAISAAGGVSPDTPQVLSGLRLPERVAVAPAPSPQVEPQQAEPAVVVVEAGDTLWGIAREHLEPDATAQETAHAWPALYALNKAVIGADPGHIEPGQRLALPADGLDGSGR